MSCAEEYTPQLRARGYRMTPQRLAILHVLHHSGRHLTPVQVFKKASEELAGIAEPTVYRTLEFLEENGLVHSSHHGGSGRTTYEITRHEHHHVVCRVCGKEEEIPHSLLKNLYQKVASASGYELKDNHLAFMGICPDCKKRRK